MSRTKSLAKRKRRSIRNSAVSMVAVPAAGEFLYDETTIENVPLFAYSFAYLFVAVVARVEISWRWSGNGRATKKMPLPDALDCCYSREEG